VGHPHLSRFALFGGLIGLALVLCGAATARPLDEVRAAGVLRVTVYRDNPPFSYVDANEQPQGVDVDLAAALAKGLGVTPQYFLLRDGETIADDLRNGVWKGTVVGEAPGDVMMHVPYDKRVEVANDMVLLFAPYYVDRLELAVDPAKTKEAEDFALFEKAAVGVDVGTLADMVLISARDKKLLNNVHHFRGTDKAFAAYESGEVDGVYAPASEIEPLAKKSKRPAALLFPANRLAKDWTVGVAVKVNSSDLGYALADEMGRLKSSGELARIFASHGLTLNAPKQPE